MYRVCSKGKKMFVCHGYSWSEEYLVQIIKSIVEIKLKWGVREEMRERRKRERGERETHIDHLLLRPSHRHRPNTHMHNHKNLSQTIIHIKGTRCMILSSPVFACMQMFLDCILMMQQLFENTPPARQSLMQYTADPTYTSLLYI